jgi:hypothetical protein
MFQVKSVERAKKTARDLRAAILDTAGIEIPYFSCLDAISRMYGFADFMKMANSIASDQPSPDQAVENGAADESRQAQIDVLIDLGVPVSAVDDVLDAVRPTGGSGPRLPVPRDAFTADQAREMADRLPLDYVRLLVRRRLLSRPHQMSGEDVGPDLEGRDFFATWFVTDDAVSIMSMFGLHDAWIGPRRLVGEIGGSALRCVADPFAMFAVESDRFASLVGRIAAMSKSVAPAPARILDGNGKAAFELIRDVMFTAIVRTVSGLPDRLVDVHLSSYLTGLAAAEACGVDLATLAFDSAFDLDPLIDFDVDAWAGAFRSLSPNLFLRDSSPKIADEFMFGALREIRAKGVAPMLLAGPLNLRLLYKAVIRADGAIALPIDLLAAAGAAGLNLSDLTAAVSAQMSVDRSAGVDQDLVSVARGFSLGGDNLAEVAIFLALLANADIGLDDLCAHAFYFDVEFPDEDDVGHYGGVPDEAEDESEESQEIAPNGGADRAVDDGSKYEVAPDGGQRRIAVAIDGAGVFEDELGVDEPAFGDGLDDDSDVVSRLGDGSVFADLDLNGAALSVGRNLLRNALAEFEGDFDMVLPTCLDALQIDDDVRRKVLDLVDGDDSVAAVEIHRALTALDGALPAGAGGARLDAMALVAGVAIGVGRVNFSPAKDESGFPLTALVLLALLEFVESSSTPEGVRAATAGELAVLHVAGNALADIVDVLSDRGDLLEWVVGLGDWRKVYDADGKVSALAAEG